MRLSLSGTLSLSALLLACGAAPEEAKGPATVNLAAPAAGDAAPAPGDEVIGLVASPLPAKLTIDGKLTEWAGLTTTPSVPQRGLAGLSRVKHERAQDSAERAHQLNVDAEKKAAKKEKREPKPIEPFVAEPYVAPPEPSPRSSIFVSPGKARWVLAGSIAKTAGDRIVLALSEEPPEMPAIGIMQRGGGLLPLDCEQGGDDEREWCESITSSHAKFTASLHERFERYLSVGLSGVDLIDKSGRKLAKLPTQTLAFAAIATQEGFEFELELPLSVLPLTQRTSLQSLTMAAAPLAALSKPSRFLDAASEKNLTSGDQWAFAESVLGPERWRHVPVNPAIVYDERLPALEMVGPSLQFWQPRNYYFAPADPSTVMFLGHEAVATQVIEQRVPLAVKVGDVAGFELLHVADAIHVLRGEYGLMPLAPRAVLVHQRAVGEATHLLFEQKEFDGEAGVERVTPLAFSVGALGMPEQLDIEDPVVDGMVNACESGAESGTNGIFVRSCQITSFSEDGSPDVKFLTYKNAYNRAVNAYLLLDGKSTFDAKTLRIMEQAQREMDRIEKQTKQLGR